MKKCKKITLILFTVALLFVSVFAVSASAIEITDYSQLDPQTTLMSVDRDGNIVNRGLLALPSTIIPPNNTAGAYQTYGDFSTVKYRWQAWSNGAFGVHSVSNYKTWIYQDYNYLDVRGQKNGAYDITVYGYHGIYDGNIGVVRDGYEKYQLLTIKFDILRSDGGSNYQLVTHTVRLNGNGPVFTLSSYLRELGYLGVYDSQRVYLKNLYVECGWDGYAGVEDFGNETFVLMHTNNGQYWEEYAEHNTFDPSMQAIISNLEYHFRNAGYQSGYVDGYDLGYQEGEQWGYDLGYQEGEQGGYEIGWEDGYDYSHQENEIVKKGFFGWIFDGIQGFMEFEIFPDFSIGLVLSVICGASLFIWLLKMFAGG